jgi:hypothetical protein
MAVVAALGVVTVACFFLLLDQHSSVSAGQANPLSITEHRIRVVAVGCKRFHKKNGFWPTNEFMILSVIPKVNPAIFQDGWSNSLKFVVNGDQRSMTLYSLGRDGKHGGQAEDADASLIVK